MNLWPWIERLIHNYGDTSLPLFKTCDSSLYYSIRGIGTPVVFIPGMAVDHRTWSLQFLYLKKWFQPIGVDNRGTGKSDGTLKGLTIEDMASDIDALINSIGVKKVHLVGYSMGGMIALEYARRKPERVNSLVLLSLPVDQPPDIFEALARDLVSSLRSGRAESVFEMAASYFFSSHFAKDRRFKIMGDLFAKSFHSYDEQAILAQLGAVRQWLMLKRWKTGCSLPCLIVFGSEDRLVLPSARLRSSSKAFPQAQHKIIKGAGHAVHIEKPDEFNRCMHDFLVSREPGGTHTVEVRPSLR